MKNLPYYKKLGFESVFSWREEDLSGFLIWDQIEAFKAIGRGDLRSGMLQDAKTSTQKYNRYKLILDIYDKFRQRLWLKDNKKNKKILFYNSKYSHLILESKKRYSVGLIVTAKKDRLFALKNSIGHIGVNDLYQYIYCYLKEKKIDYLHQLVKRVEEKLRVAKPNYVVLWVDNFPIERAIVLACKRLGIPTLEIQHGLCHLDLDLTSGRMVDHLLVWGQYFKDLYLRRKIKKPEEISILGYPYEISKPQKPVPDEKKKYIVYCLGEGYEKHTKGVLSIKLKTITELNKICKKLDLEFFYRPHPLNDIKMLKSKLPKIVFTSKDEKIFDTIAKGDIFIAYSSTTLIEAAIRSKVALQLMNYRFPLIVDNFEKLGACTKSFQNIEQLSEYLGKIVKSRSLNKIKFEFNNSYVETRYNLGQRFIEILNQINNTQTKKLGS